MMFLVTAIFSFLLVSLTLYLHVAGAFHASPLFSSFRLAVYMLLMFIALTLGIGIIVNRSDNPLGVE